MRGFSRSRGCVGGGQGRSTLQGRSIFARHVNRLCGVPAGRGCDQTRLDQNSPPSIAKIPRRRGCVDTALAARKDDQARRRQSPLRIVSAVGKDLIKPSVAGAKSPGVVSIRLWWRSPCKDLIKPGLFAPCPPRLTLGFGLHDRSSWPRAGIRHVPFVLQLGHVNHDQARLDQACHGQSRPRQSPSIGPWLRLNFADCVGSGQGLSRPRSVWPPSSSPVAKSPGCVDSAWRRSLLATSTTRKPDSPCSVCSKPVCGVPAGRRLQSVEGRSSSVWRAGISSVGLCHVLPRSAAPTVGYVNHDQSSPRQSPSIGPWARFSLCGGSGSGQCECATFRFDQRRVSVGFRQPRPCSIAKVDEVPRSCAGPCFARLPLLATSIASRSSSCSPPSIAFGRLRSTFVKLGGRQSLKPRHRVCVARLRQSLGHAQSPKWTRRNVLAMGHACTSTFARHLQSPLVGPWARFNLCGVPAAQTPSIRSRTITLIKLAMIKLGHVNSLWPGQWEFATFRQFPDAFNLARHDQARRRSIS